MLHPPSILRLLAGAWLALALPALAGATVVPLTQDALHVSGSVSVAVPLANGQTIIGGNFDSVNGARQPRLARLNADGTLDQAWRPQVSSRVTRVAVDGDEVYFVASVPMRTKLSGSGEIDRDWAPFSQPPGSKFYEIPSQITLGGQFVYLLCSRYDVSGTKFDFVGYIVRRYYRDAKGTLDRSWTPKVLGRATSSAELLADTDYLYLRHDVAQAGDGGSTIIERYSVLGKGPRDPRWRLAIRSTSVFGVSGLAMDEDYVYLAGSQLRVGRTSPVCAARFSKITAKSDRNWPAEALAFQEEQFDVAVNGRTAFFASTSGISAVGTGLDNPNGALAFTTAIANNAYLRLAAGMDAIYLLQGNSNVFLIFDTIVFRPEQLRRIDSETGAKDLAYKPLISEPAQIIQVLRQPDGTTYVAGRIDNVGGVANRNLVRFQPDGTYDATWTPLTLAPSDEPGFVLSDVVKQIGASGAFLYAAVSLNGQSLFQVVRFSLASPGRVDETWDPSSKLDATLGPNQSGYSSDVVMNGGYVYVLYQSFNATTFADIASRVYRIPLSGDGSPDPNWSLNLDLKNNFRRLFIHQGFLYVSGFIGQRFSLAGSGARDTGWEISRPGDLATGDADYLYMASGTSLKRYLLTGNGSSDPNFAPQFATNFNSGSPKLNSILALDSHLYVSGRFDKVNATAHTNVARLDATGNAEADFSPSVPFVDSSSPSSDSPLWIGALGTNPILGGIFAEIDGAPALPPVLFNSLPPPTLTHAGPKVFAQLSGSDSLGVTYFRLTAIAGGTVASGGSPVAVGDFVSVGTASAGLDFTPDPNFSGARSLSLASASGPTAPETGATSNTIDLTDTSVPVSHYRMNVSAIMVREGTPAATVTVQKVGADLGSVTFMLEEGSARLGTHFSAPASFTLDFPAGDGMASIQVPLVDDLIFTGNKDFRVVLTGATNGGLVLSPNATAVTIVDDDPLSDTNSLTTLPALPGLPLGDASLTVALNAPLGAWRLLGEAIWHPSGATLNGLTRGNYFLEFRPANGFIAPPARTVPADFGESVSISGNYLALGSSPIGALAVAIEPASVANAAGNARGQWRLVGEVTWRDSGDTVENLSAGPYDVEFKIVPGRETPPPQTINVAGSVVYSITGTYLIAAASTGAIPEPVDFATVQTLPYALVGQIRSSVGFASGTAVRDRVVLTVGHALFDDATFSAVTSTLWFHQKARGNFEPPPQEARGWYIFAGYATQRGMDLESGAGGIGISTTESQQFDVAALWFLEPCARGSFAGYLKTDAQNDWLLAARRHILAGYPVENVADNAKGVLHATDPGVSSTFTAPNAVVRATGDLKGFGGMSGGPLFVEENSAFYPAGVFLGGTAQCLVRVIDGDAVDLINRGETSGNGGDNNVGGGISLVAPGVTNSPYAPTLLGCTLAPTDVILQGAAWRIAGEGTYRPSGTRVPVIPGNYRLEFKPVAGYVPPDPVEVTLVQGQVATSRNTYVSGALIQTTVSPADAGTAPSGYYPLGQPASLKATPGPNYIFDAWMENGTVISRSAILPFNANGPRSFVAMFKAGTFVPYAGAYAGLHLTGGLTDGLAAFTLTGNGSFTGKVTFRGKTYSVKGVFVEDGVFSGLLGPYSVLLQLDRTNPAGAIVGQIFDGGIPTTFTATQSPYSTAAATTLAGNYTLLLPSADPADASKPPGSGVARFTVTTAGAVSFAGTLADGVGITGSGQLIDGDFLPIYAATFKGLGGLSGQLRFHKVAGQSDADGPLRWVRPPAGADKYYPAGFETTLPAIASTYVAPPVDYSTATLKLKGGGLASEVTRALSINTSNFTVTSSEDPALRFTIDRKTGLISGNLTSPATNKKLPIGGAVFQTSRHAAGYFKSPAPTTGALEITPGP